MKSVHISIAVLIGLLANVFIVQAVHKEGRYKMIEEVEEFNANTKRHIVVLNRHEDHDIAMKEITALGNSTTAVLKAHKGAMNYLLVDGYEFESLNGLDFVYSVHREQMMHIFDAPPITDLWGLDRIDEIDISDGYDNEPFDPLTTGKDVDIYVIDTGLSLSHPEFVNGSCPGGRVIQNIFSAYGPDDDPQSDDHGHGTHCAGTAAGTYVGVARCSNIYGMKVLSSSGSGTIDDIIDAMEMVLERHQGKGDGAKSVVSMSLGGGCGGDCQTSPMVTMTNMMASYGIIVSVAAGNSNSNADSFSPAAAEHALTVGASTINDARASFSNYGEGVDLYAPGQNILSAALSGGYVAWSGTSMACPHVSGVAALIIEKAGQAVIMTDLHAVNTIRDSMLCEDVPAIVSGVPVGTNNLLQIPVTADSCKVWMYPTEEPSAVPTGPTYEPTFEPTMTGSFPRYQASNTNSATANTIDETIYVCPGATYEFSMCSEMDGTECSGDTYLRLNDASGNEVVANDDKCGLCSGFEIAFTLPCQNYVLRQGCWGSGACSGQVRMVQVGESAPTDAPTQLIPTDAPTQLVPTNEPTSALIDCHAHRTYVSGKNYIKNAQVTYKGKLFKAIYAVDSPEKWEYVGQCMPISCASLPNWIRKNSYIAGDKVKVSGKYYSAKKNSSKKNPTKAKKFWILHGDC